MKLCELKPEIITQIANKLNNEGRVSDFDSLGLASGMIEKFDDADRDALFKNGYIQKDGICLNTKAKEMPNEGWKYVIFEDECNIDA